MSQSTRVYLVRHGETFWNSQGQYQGHSNVDLSDTGRAQARALAGELAGVELAAVYASDLGRAMETASIIAAPHGLVPVAVPELREVNFGRWEGLTFAEIDRDYAELARQWRTSPGQVLFPMGENFAQVKERAYQKIIDLVNEHLDQNILVVSHGGTIRSIICAVLDVPLDKIWCFRQDNTAVNIIDFYEQRAILSLLNSTHHLVRLHEASSPGES